MSSCQIYQINVWIFSNFNCCISDVHKFILVQLKNNVEPRKMFSLDFHIWLSFLSLFLGMILSNHRSSNKCNIVQYLLNSFNEYHPHTCTNEKKASNTTAIPFQKSSVQNKILHNMWIIWSSRPRYWYYQYCNTYIYNTGITSIIIFTILEIPVL